MGQASLSMATPTRLIGKLRKTVLNFIHNSSHHLVFKGGAGPGVGKSAFYMDWHQSTLLEDCAMMANLQTTKVTQPSNKTF
jgi:hypothetical protein